MHSYDSSSTNQLKRKRDDNDSEEHVEHEERGRYVNASTPDECKLVIDHCSHVLIYNIYIFWIFRTSDSLSTFSESVKTGTKRKVEQDDVDENYQNGHIRKMQRAEEQHDGYAIRAISLRFRMIREPSFVVFSIENIRFFF